ncbi:hypothetical protein WN51_11618 [Melipona quadrifasciata]|uniref:Uncharacterized protein n=1 Tax=Melipona quadrifasciata TaxID=166423 RepID=A0A0M9A370_9HYME|nr:hypothetical protein WN51_11618 [Melipona quadrifasciata]
MSSIRSSWFSSSFSSPRSSDGRRRRGEKKTPRRTQAALPSNECGWVRLPAGYVEQSDVEGKQHQRLEFLLFLSSNVIKGSQRSCEERGKHSINFTRAAIPVLCGGRSHNASEDGNSFQRGLNVFKMYLNSLPSARKYATGDLERVFETNDEKLALGIKAMLKHRTSTMYRSIRGMSSQTDMDDVFLARQRFLSTLVENPTLRQPPIGQNSESKLWFSANQGICIVYCLILIATARLDNSYSGNIVDVRFRLGTYVVVKADNEASTRFWMRIRRMSRWFRCPNDKQWGINNPTTQLTFQMKDFSKKNYKKRYVILETDFKSSLDFKELASWKIILTYSNYLLLELEA